MFDVLWFVLGGFVLGFTTSLLWEWLYFRRQRLTWKNREVSDLKNQVMSLQTQLEQRAGGFVNERESAGTIRESNIVGNSPAQPDNFQSSAALLEGEQVAAMPQARRAKGKNRSAKPTAMPGGGQHVNQARSALPTASVQGQPPLERVTAEEHRKLRTDLPRYESDRVAANKPRESQRPAAVPVPVDGDVSIAQPNTGGEIGAFNEQSFFENAMQEPIEPAEQESVGSETAPQEDPVHVESLTYSRAPQTSSHAEAKLASVTTVQPISQPHSDRPAESHASSSQLQADDVPTYNYPATSHSKSPSDVEATQWVDGPDAPADINQAVNQPVNQPAASSFAQDAYRDVAVEEAEALGVADAADGFEQSDASFGVAPPVDRIDNQPVPENYAELVGQEDYEYVDYEGPDYEAQNFDVPDYAAQDYEAQDYEAQDYEAQADAVQGESSDSHMDPALAQYHDQYGPITSAVEHIDGGGVEERANEWADAGQTEATAELDLADLDADKMSHASEVDFYTDTDADEEFPTVTKVMTDIESPQRRASATGTPSVNSRLSPPWDVDPTDDERQFDAAVPLAKLPENKLITSTRRNGMRKNKILGTISRIRKDEIEYPDDLSKIKGIGPKFQERLYASGIYTWDQLSKSKPEVVEAATQPRINEDVTEWISEARKLAFKNGRLGATYSGPIPSNLSEIDTLTPGNMWRLYHHGIASFSQLASAKKSTLTEIFDGVAGASKLDFSVWSKEARKRAKKL